MINQNNPIFRICSSCCDATTNLQRISGNNLKRLNIYTAENVNQLKLISISSYSHVILEEIKSKWMCHLKWGKEPLDEIYIRCKCMKVVY